MKDVARMLLESQACDAIENVRDRREFPLILGGDCSEEDYDGGVIYECGAPRRAITPCNE
jgi:hypothetical protein